MRSFYLQFCIYAIQKKPFSGTYPLFYSNSWSFYMQIHYIRAYFWSPYLSKITRSTCRLSFSHHSLNIGTIRTSNKSVYLSFLNLSQGFRCEKVSIEI